jgi:hypothetical protein
MTTNLETRKAYWESVYWNLRDWQILAGPFRSKAEAQLAETQLANRHGCEHSSGGDDPGFPNAVWYVYGFNHDGRKVGPRPAYRP